MLCAREPILPTVCFVSNVKWEKRRRLGLDEKYIFMYTLISVKMTKQTQTITPIASKRCAQRRLWFSGLTFPQASTLRPTTALVSLVAVVFVQRSFPIPPTKLTGNRIGKVTHANGTKMTSSVLRYRMKK